MSGMAAMEGEEMALWRDFRSAGSIPARERLFGHYAGFARSIARRHYRERSQGDIELNDLEQLSYAGLLEAMDRFELEHGTPFRPFAVHRINGSIRDGVSRMTEMREQFSWRHRVRRERLQSLSMTGDNAPATTDLVAGLSELAVGLALGFMLEGTGLFTMEQGEESSDGGPSASAYDSLAWKQTAARLDCELAALPEREQMILRQHYQMGMDFAGIGALLRISKGRVSQLHRAALQLLRKRMLAQGHFHLER